MKKLYKIHLDGGDIVNIPCDFAEMRDDGKSLCFFRGRVDRATMLSRIYLKHVIMYYVEYTNE